MIGLLASVLFGVFVFLFFSVFSVVKEKIDHRKHRIKIG